MIRSKELTEFLDSMSKEMFGVSFSEAMKDNICVSCKVPITGFRNFISLKEFTLSGLCQECQDSVFGVD